MDRVDRHALFAAVLIGAAVVLLAGCAAPITPTLVITSVKQGATAVVASRQTPHT
jgi:uncharacterized lipoprotein YajG